MKFHYFIFLFLSPLITSIFLGCAGIESNKMETAKTKPVEVENLSIQNYFVLGKNKQIFTEVPRRVIVIGENEVETLVRIGAADSILMVMGRNKPRFPLEPEIENAIEALPTADRQSMNVEYISQLKPDLIIGSQYCFTRDKLNSTDYWNKHGVKTLVSLSSSQPRRHYIKETVDGEMETIRNYGRIFHKEEAANKLVDDTYKTIDEINERAKNYPKPRVMIIELMSTYVSYDKTKLAGNMAESIGAEAISTPAIITFEHIAKEDPDVLILICSHDKYGACRPLIMDHPGLKNTKCVKNNRVYNIPLEYTYGPLCHTKDGIKMMGEAFYP